MKMKTSELTGAALDWAVARIERLPRDVLAWGDGQPVIQRSCLGHTDTLRCEFSSNWAQGGPIVEREGIALEHMPFAKEWEARLYPTDGTPWVLTGPTPLIAALRCYVASKLGDDIEIPEELK